MADPHDILERPAVVGITGDASCEPAVDMARQLAERFGTPLELVHTLRDTLGLATGMSSIEIEELNEERRRAAWADMADRLAKLGSPPVSIADCLRIEMGAPARALVRRARTLDAGMIIVGRHRPRPILDLGSTARALMVHAPCAVWCQTEPALPWRRVLVPVDMSDDCRHAVRIAALLAQRADAALHLLHAYVAPVLAYPPKGRLDLEERLRSAAREKFEEFVAQVAPEGVEMTSEFVNETPTDAVLSRQFGYELIVMATQGRGKISSAVLGSVTHGVLRHAVRPVVAVPHPADLEQRGKMSVDSFHVTA